MSDFDDPGYDEREDIERQHVEVVRRLEAENARLQGELEAAKRETKGTLTALECAQDRADKLTARLTAAEDATAEATRLMTYWQEREAAERTRREQAERERDEQQKRADWLSGAYDAEKQRALDNARGTIEHWRREAELLRHRAERAERDREDALSTMERLTNEWADKLDLARAALSPPTESATGGEERLKEAIKEYLETGPYCSDEGCEEGCTDVDNCWRGFFRAALTTDTREGARSELCGCPLGQPRATCPTHGPCGPVQPDPTPEPAGEAPACTAPVGFLSDGKCCTCDRTYAEHGFVDTITPAPAGNGEG